jgi:hypothetical protein
MQATDIWDLTFLAAGEGEGGNGYFLLAILIISAIHWVSQRLKEKREADRLARSAPDVDDSDWESEDDWEPVSTAPPRPANEELRRFFETLAGKPEPVIPPPVPRRVQAPAPPPVKPPPIPAGPPPSLLTREEQLALESIKARKSNLTQGRSHRQRVHASTEHTALAKMLRDPVGMRNAFILKEILEPPVAARDDQNPHTV